MIVLKIFNVDKNDNEKPLCTLRAGEHVFGRGSFANCIDKKISRRHIIINVQDNEAVLTLIHISPIFFMSSNAPNIQMLKKDETIRLSDGDKFAFLIDTWYSVKIEDNENTPQTIAGSSASTVLISNPISTTETVASTSDTKVSQSASLKRSTDASYSEERKRLKLMNESLDRLKDNIDQIVAQDFQNDEDPNKETTKEVENNNAKEVYKKDNMSDSDDEDSDAEMLPEVTRDTEVVTGVQVNSEINSVSGSDIVNNDNNGNSSDILDDINKEPMVQNGEVKIEPSEVKEEPVNDEENTKEVSESQPVDQISVHENGDTAEADQNIKEVEQNPADASASSSGVSMGNSVRREQCWYGQNCYRKNTSHKDQFSHPGDSDYSETSGDNRSQCPYGAQCYRTNPQHRKDFGHPTSRPAPKPSNIRKRRTNVHAQSNVDYDSDSQDEDEPFSADESSSDSEVFGAGDSDSDYMGEPNFDDMEDGEEVEIMFKEAKKFLRKKRKD
ncbi:aprataxin and PNK-like factor isoform X2 [Coccinella septempunctata]|uniref:aprataxin and PNK-like factor isoform X2 n=1 Tax=Coccinella septempunctata TaxID=41139 RepID=UPI001D08ED4D|nr:aprataxin and PNK-like factor isoform X2 [Coccinella septempunctata]